MANGERRTANGERRTANLRVLVAATAVTLAPFCAASSCESHQPIGDLRGFAIDLTRIQAAYGESSGVVDFDPTTGLSVPGDVQPTAAAACARQLLESDQVRVLPAGEVSAFCGGGIACTQTIYSACADEICIPDDLVPTELLENAPSASTAGRRNLISALHVLSHEAIHTEQRQRFGECQRVGSSGPPDEIEAYGHQRELAQWIASQLFPPGDAGPFTRAFIGGPASCRPFADYPALHPIWAQLFSERIPGFDPAAPFAPDVCEALAGIDGILQSNGTWLSEAASQIGVYNTAFQECMTGSVERSPHLREIAACPNTFVSASPNSSVLYHYRRNPAGTLSEVGNWSFPANITSVNVATEPATGACPVIQVAFEGSTFAFIRDLECTASAPGDCIFDAVASASDSRLREGSSIVDAGPSRPALLFDRPGQRVFRFRYDANGRLAGLSPTLAFAIPLGREASEVRHSRDLPMAIATGDDASQEDRLMRFEDVANTGVYALSAVGAPADIGPFPPSFAVPPTAGSAYVLLRGRLGNLVHLLPVDEEGVASGAALGSGVIGADGLATILLTRPLVLDERVRGSDVSDAILGAYPSVTGPRPMVYAVSPQSGPPTGGTVVTLRGSGLSGVSEVRVGDATATGLTVVSDQVVQFVAPPGSEPSSVSVQAGQFSHVVGSFRYDSNILGSWSSTLSSWSSEGTGWSCGAAAIDPTSMPVSGSRAGCQYSGSIGTWGSLLSPTVPLPSQGGPFAIRVHYRGDFASDGDGLVLAVETTAGGFALRPRDEGTRRVHAASCTGNGASRSCAADSPYAGAQGLAGTSAARVWRTSWFDLPPNFFGGNDIAVRLVASNMGAGSAIAQVAYVDVVRIEGRADAVEAGAAQLALFDECADVSRTALWSCESTYPGASGSVLRFQNTSPGRRGLASLPVSFAGLAGRRVTLRMRHFVDFTAGPTVGSGFGRVRVCCGLSCSTVQPVDGYPPARRRNAFNDEGPDGASWMTDEFDLSAFAGDTRVCRVILRGRGSAPPSQPGWVVDGLEVAWR